MLAPGPARRRARWCATCSTPSPTRCRAARRPTAGRDAGAPRGAARPTFERAAPGPARPAPAASTRRDLPQLVRLSLRVEADEEELVAGAVRLVPQVHDEQNPLHLCDLALLWTDDAGRARLRRPGPHARHDRAARRGRRLAGARPAARAAGARPAHARHRRAGQPARRGRRRAARARRRRAVAAQPGPRPDRDDRASTGPRRRRRARSRCNEPLLGDRGAVRLPLAGRRCTATR